MRSKAKSLPLGLSPPEPELIGHFLGMAIAFEGRGVILPRVGLLLAADPDRYADLCGKHSRNIMSLLDWRGSSTPHCITAASNGEIVGAAWAGAIQCADDRSNTGCNLSFAVDPRFAGRGLASLLASLAFGRCLMTSPDLRFANIQTYEGNVAARALADRLGLPREREFDRVTPGEGCRLYVTYRAPVALLAERCADIIAQAFEEIECATPHAEAPTG